jgi:hypothetical protein
MANVTRAASTKTAPKGRPTPSQGSTKERSAKTEDRIALFQWFLVFAVIAAIAVIAAVVVGPGEGPTVSGGGHGG